MKTFQHEAAHYQAAFAQQRMIIQSLEDDLDKGSKESEDQLVEMQNELDQVNQNLLSRNSEVKFFPFLYIFLKLDDSRAILMVMKWFFLDHGLLESHTGNFNITIFYTMWGKLLIETWVVFKRTETHFRLP